MKLHLTFKTPDVLEDAAKEYAERAKENAAEDGILTEEDVEEIYQNTYDKLMASGKKWVRNGEYISVMIDTDTGTCTVNRA